MEGILPETKGWKIFQSIGVNIAYVTVTLNLGLIGPCMLEFERQTGGTTSTLSSTFTLRALLGLAASLTTGYLLDRVNRLFLVGLFLLIDVVFIVASPWCSSIISLVAVLSIPEFFNSAIGMATHLLCIDLWEDASAPALHTLNLMGTIGYMIAPALVLPFITSTESSNSVLSSINRTNPSIASNMSNIEWHSFEKRGFPTPSDVRTISSTNQYPNDNRKLYPFYALPTQSTIDSLDLPGTFYPYTISAVVTVLAGVLLLIEVFGRMRFSCCKTVFVRYTPEDDSIDNQSATSVRFRTIISILFFIFNVFYAGIEVGYAGLLTTFAVKYLDWPEKHGNNATILLQLSNCIGTLAAIFVSNRIHPRNILLASVILVNIALLTLCLYATSHHLVLWICTGFLGLGYATIMPCSYSWVQGVMEVDGRFSSWYWSGFFVGFMAVPATMGYIFEYHTPMGMPYVGCLCAICMSVMLLIILLFAFVYNSSVAVNRDGNEDNKQPLPVDV